MAPYKKVEELDEKVKEELLKIICEMIDGVDKKYESETVRIRFSKDIDSRLHASGIRLPYYMNLSKIAYELVESVLVKSIKVLRGDPDKPRQFLMYKTEWKEFREKHKLYRKT